jgi:hypothetical protein
MPLLAGDARGRPHRRRPTSTTSSAKLSTGIAPLPLPGALARLGPAPHRERQHAVVAAAPPRRWPCSASAHGAQPPPTSSPCPLDHAEPVPPRR